MIKIPASILKEIYDHAEKSYPYECCGVMGGTMIGENKTVFAFHICKNLNVERARDRYEMDPRDQLRADREFREHGWDVIGMYHSHPDHPSRPSQTDTDAAHEGYSYVIISVEKGKVAKAQSWLLNGAEKKFYEEEISE